MKKLSMAKLVSTGGILTAFAVLFQSAPVFLPGIGLFLSPFATLPTALAVSASIYTGIITFIASAIFILLISPQEAIIYLLSTGLLGLALGATHSKSFIISVLTSAVTLFTGINILVRAAGIAVFGGLTPYADPLISITVFALFSTLYSCIWAVNLKYFIRILKRTELFVRAFSKGL